jgi:transcriptional regulator
MYIPASFAENDVGTLHALMRQNAFATLVSVCEGVPVASHIPFLLDAERGPHGTLLGHLARANPQWRLFDRETLAVFQGPHAYVSPTWYASSPNVPTWNYAVVHAYGRPQVIEGGAARAVIERLVATYEGDGGGAWSTAAVPDEFVRQMLAAIVAFEMPVARLEGKFKLSQNRTEADRAGVVARLRLAGGPDSAAVAELMARLRSE